MVGKGHSSHHQGEHCKLPSRLALVTYAHTCKFIDKTLDVIKVSHYVCSAPDVFLFKGNVVALNNTYCFLRQPSSMAFIRVLKPQLLESF